MHKDIATAQLFGGFVDQCLGTVGVRNITLHEHPVRPRCSDQSERLLGFVRTAEVMNRNFLDPLLS